MKPDEPWFLNQHGTRYKKMRQALKTACKNAKVPHCTHHFTETCSRDDSANEGKDIGTISKLLGHANPTITENIYVHWPDEQIHEARWTWKSAPKSCKKCKIGKWPLSRPDLACQVIEGKMPRDGVEPPTPAFSGPRSTS